MLALSAFAAPVVHAAENDARSSMVIEEIIVTARKRSENLQETPISITAFTAGNLEARQITSISEIDEATPNLVFDIAAPSSGSNSAASVFIRGIGQLDFVPTTDPGVGIYVDGVYYARAVGAALDFLDLERIEVLRGPQGTLFGRNTIGGALNIISKRPSADPGGNVSITGGQRNHLDISGNINIPLSDKLLTKVSVTSRNRDGYVKDRTSGIKFGDDNTASVRGSVLWKPTENFEALFIGDYTREREESAPNVLIQADPTRAFPGFHNNVIVGNCAVPETNPACFSSAYVGAPFQTNQEQKSASDLDYWGLSMTLSWNLDWVTLKSITAYRNLDSYSTRDADHAPMVIFETTDLITQDQFSQEFQFSGTAINERLEWLLGLYYFEESANNQNFVDISVGSILSGGLVKNDSKAIFAQATYSFTEKLKLTGGLRYTKDRKRFTPKQVTLTNIATPRGIMPPGIPVLPDVEKKTTAGEWTPMVNLSYQWTDAIMTYATYSKGFKSGGFTQRVFPPIVPAPGQDPAEVIPSFDPEFVKSYEVGYKSTFWDRRVQLNVAAFYTDYNNMQILVREAVAPITVNAAKATMKGAEAELIMMPASGLTVTSGLGYLHSKYNALDARAVGITLNSKFVNAPKWTLSGSVSYDIPASALKGVVTPRVDVSYTSKIYNDSVNTPSATQNGYALVNASIAYQNDEGSWRMTAGVRNLTNKVYLTQASANLNTGGYVEGVYGRPREWSLTLRKVF